MPLPAILLIIATVLPLASFTLLVFVGKRIGKPLAGYVGTFAIGLSFLFSILAMIAWVQGGKYTPGGEAKPIDYGMGKYPINLPMQWVPAGYAAGVKTTLKVGVYVDSLTIVMFAMITLVATLVHVFSLAYMADDKRFPRFFTYLGLFCFSMLGLVLGGTILQLFIFWELVGLCSYLLIGFWYEKKTASNAAIKAFVVNRVGDFGFLIGLGILFYHLGNVTLPDVWNLLEMGKLTANGIQMPGGVWFGPTLLTVMGVGLFFGAVGKSAQFPLHVWLPDAMEGPTPVSALIHAATMVAAGVYLVGRIFPILTPDARLFIAIIGLVTLTMAALIAIAQSDIKKVLAYSTLSQLGYMILAMGVGSWIGGLFHLITHAFFKALLFLGSGSVIHAAHHEQEMHQYGGLMRKIPVTAITFAIAVLAIAGTPGLSAYYSKDMILAHAGGYAGLGAAYSKWYWVFFVVPSVIAVVTAFYMTRCWMLTFWGKPRNQHLYDHAHEAPLLYIPLILLAIPSIIGGKYMMVQQLIESSMGEGSRYVAHVRNVPEEQGKKYDLYAQAWPGEPGGSHIATETAAGESASQNLPHSQELFKHAEHTVHTVVVWAFAVGIGIGIAIYFNGYAVANMLMKIPPLRVIHTWLYRRMFFDELYAAVFVAITMGLARLSALFDRVVVDGLVNFAAHFVKKTSDLAGLNDKYIVDGAVNGMASATQSLGSAVRAPQSGRIRMYVTVLLAAVVIGIAAMIVVVISK
ncbi:MAG TPA: NADH-quinone oxidoreductase subunit L [Tepidisphaeraceae bacterium]|jgi:proton-translocating NADH-quinone oxidoreductase chain L|nr:NADH-quinone oxidoreductase subunit L [Tepidisphaeraceae bacterium]